MTNEAARPAAAHPTVGSTTPVVLRGAGGTCRVRSWPFQPDVAQMVVVTSPRSPSDRDLELWADALTAAGYRTVRTGAVATGTGERLAHAGYHPVQELVLLCHDHPSEAAAPELPTARLARSAPARQRASDVDRAAFDDGWQLDPAAVDDVCRATPRHRARTAGDGVHAYAISGRDARQGFLQRLAVEPDHQGSGLGRALVADSLRWLARRRVQRVLVNTPVDNDRALELYERAGFRRLPEPLRVYERDLP